MMMDNASVLEIIWSGAALICGGFNLRIWWDAVADYRYIEATEQRLTRILTAQDQLMVHSLLLAIQAVVLLIGVVAMTQPSDNTEHTLTLTRVIIAGGLVSIELMLALIAVWSRRNWRRIVTILAAERRRMEATK